VTTYMEIEPTEPEWLWSGRIPMAEVALVAGEGGIGKGQLLCELAARVSRGDVMPDGTSGGPAGSVVMVTPEDDLNSTVAYRLRAVRADLSMIHDLTTLASGGPFELPDNLGELREAIDAIGDVRLVIIDPLMATASVSLASNVSCRRKVMAPLQRLAKDTGVAVVVSHHLVKSGAVAGSRGLTDAARIVHRVTRDPANPAVREFSVEKINIGADDLASLRYTVTGEGTKARVSWLWRSESGRLGKPAGDAQHRILMALRGAEGPLTGQQLAHRTGVAYSVVRVALVKLVRRGLAERGERGEYVAAELDANVTPLRRSAS
jgi:AAA domain/MarR family